ncbi:MAG: phosphotransferase [Pseudomonadota bacterium]
MLSRYAEASGDDRPYDLIHLANSSVSPEARAVFRLHHRDGDLALKLDLDGEETGRPAREYQTLTRLMSAFEQNPDVALIAPVWCDPEGLALITRFVSGPTALQAAADDPTTENMTILGQKGALFLNTLHSAEPAEEIGYWPEWVIKRLMDFTFKTGPRAPQIGAERCRELIQAFRRISDNHRGTACLKTLAHGDFHGGNLVISEQAVTGLDMTEIRRKLGLYDVVDYLTSVDIQRPDLEQLSDLGVHPALEDAFTQVYTHPLPREVLRCAMLGKWLILTFKITRARHAAYDFQRTKLTRLLHRIGHMI